METWVKRECASGADAEWRRQHRAAGITGIVLEDGRARVDERFVAVVDDVRGRRRLGREDSLAAAQRLVDEYAGARLARRDEIIREHNAKKKGGL